MSTSILGTPARFGPTHDWMRAGAALALGLVGLGILFREDVAAAFRVWEESTAYNHCYLILPIAAFLAWERRARFATTSIIPMPRAALLALPLGLAWLVAERIGVMEGRQLVVLTLVQVLLLAVLGWRMCRAFAAPLIYLYFLVPFGAFLTPQLQDFTARFSIAGLDLLGIANYSDGYTIEIPEGVFYVAEACAGLRFLIASVAFGTLYAFVIYRGIWRRLAFIAVSVVVPIVANGFRAMGIVALGHVLGSAQAAATDHVLYGWIFFSLVILALTVAGLPFRQDREPLDADAGPSTTRQPVGARAPAIAAIAVVAMSIAGPVVAERLDARSDAESVAMPPQALAAVGCTTAPDASAAQAEHDHPAGAPGAFGRFLCDEGRIALQLMILPARSSPSEVMEARRRLTGSLTGEEVDTHWRRSWLLTEAENVDDAVATGLWIEGQQVRAGLKDRLAQARNSLLGSSHLPVLMAVSLQSDPAAKARRGASREIQAYLDANGEALSERAAALSKR